MSDPRVERLRIEIELKRAALFEHRAELFKLQTQLESFAADYERVVGILETALEAVRTKIRQAKQTTDSFWGPGISSFQEYFAQRQAAAGEAVQPKKKAVSDDDLRTVYRRLARKYHPDTTTDPEEQKRLGAIMARINAAYGDRDLDTLRTMDGETTAQVMHTVRGAPDTYQELLALSYQLDDEIAWTRIEYNNLAHGELQRLKIEYSLARAQGRDLLREMAANVQRELDAARAELAALRGRG